LSGGRSAGSPIVAKDDYVLGDFRQGDTSHARSERRQYRHSMDLRS
jgi:hypothetical protein